MPIPQMRFVHCAQCGAVITIETCGDALTPEEFLQFSTPRKKQLCKSCKKAARKKWFARFARLCFRASF